MRVELSDGEWADIRPVEDLRDGDRKAVNRSIRVEVDDDGRGFLPGDANDRKRDALLARLIDNWSFATTKGLPLPSADPASLDKLSIRHARELHRATKEHMDLIEETDTPETRGSLPTSA